MASVRLTTTIRNQILSAAMKGVYDNVQAQIDTKLVDLSERIYRTLVTEEQERMMNQLPHGFFNLSDAKSASIRASNGGSYRHLDLKFKQDKRLPAFCSGYNNINISDDVLYEETLELAKARRELNEMREKLRADITAVLNSANTVQKLLEVWPEAKSYIPDYVFTEKASLPAIITDKINEALALAKGEPVAA